MSNSDTPDPVMQQIRKRFAASGLTQQQLGERMGYPSASARQSVSRFLKTKDPLLSMLRRFAKAMGITLATLTKPR